MDEYRRIKYYQFMAYVYLFAYFGTLFAGKYVMPIKLWFRTTHRVDIMKFPIARERYFFMRQLLASVAFATSLAAHYREEKLKQKLAEKYLGTKKE